MILYLKVVVGVEGVLVWLGGHWDEEEAGVWTLGLEMLGHQAESQQGGLEWKKKPNKQKKQDHNFDFKFFLLMYRY